LIVASPALQLLLVYPQAVSFTEVWLLGPSHTAGNYPYNITANQNYTVYFGVANHLESFAYYQIQVKFCNETQSTPDSLNSTPSSMPPLYNINMFVAQNETQEIPVDFSFDYSFQNVTRTVYNNVTIPPGAGSNGTVEQRAENVTFLQAIFRSLRLTGVALDLKGYSSDWNLLTRRTSGNLVFEVWIYNNAVGGFQYHERFVNLKLNITPLE